MLEQLFPDEFFSFSAYVYGFLASFLFTMATILNALRQFDESKGADGGITKIGYLLFAIQPFVGGLMAFIAVPVGRAIYPGLGVGFVILLSMTVGFFFGYLTETVFMKKVFSKYIENKYLKEDK
jgi:hypothetical protein